MKIKKLLKTKVFVGVVLTVVVVACSLPTVIVQPLTVAACAVLECDLVVVDGD